MNQHNRSWGLPKHDYWSTPFAESLLQHLDICPGLKILDVASGHGIPSFYLAEQVGPTGEVLAIDASAGQVARAKAIQGSQLPWLRFECADMRALPADPPPYLVGAPAGDRRAADPPRFPSSP